MINTAFITGTAGFFMQNDPVDVPESFQKTFRFLQGDGIYEEGIMYFLSAMKDRLYDNYNPFIADAQALAAIFMLIFFAIKCYEMMAGDKKLEIMPLLRPFGLIMVILWWLPFVKAISYPTKLITYETEMMFDSNQATINNLRMQRAKLMVEVADDLLTIQARTDIAQKEAETWYEQAWAEVDPEVKEGFGSIWNPILELRNRFQIGLQLLLTSALETLAIWTLRICVYIIFIIQIIFSIILIILGPFSVAVSILPAFRDSFSTWIARYISVSLYSGIAFLILYVSSMFQEFVLTIEIQKYQELLSVDGEKIQKMAWFASNGVLSFGFVIVVFIIGALTMLTVPSISTWIVSTSGITSAASTMGRGASNMSRMVKAMIKK